MKYVNAGTVTTKMLYDGADCVADYNNDLELQRYYITPMLDENLLQHQASDSEDYYYTHDGLGTVREILNTSQQTQNSYDFLAFGTKNGSPTENVDNRFKFTGRELDTETSSANSTALYYYRARTYDSEIGSFIGRDPFRFWFNLYHYVKNNPVTFLDPWGLEEEEKHHYPKWFLPSFRPPIYTASKGASSGADTNDKVNIYIEINPALTIGSPEYYQDVIHEWIAAFIWEHTKRWDKEGVKGNVTPLQTFSLLAELAVMGYTGVGCDYIETIKSRKYDKTNSQYGSKTLDSVVKFFEYCCDNKDECSDKKSTVCGDELYGSLEMEGHPHLFGHENLPNYLMYNYVRIWFKFECPKCCGLPKSEFAISLWEHRGIFRDRPPWKLANAPSWWVNSGKPADFHGSTIIDK